MIYHQSLLQSIVPQKVQRPAHRIAYEIRPKASVGSKDTTFILEYVLCDPEGAPNACRGITVDWKT
jgi:hypothetical protein